MGCFSRHHVEAWAKISGCTHFSSWFLTTFWRIHIAIMFCTAPRLRAVLRLCFMGRSYRPVWRSSQNPQLRRAIGSRVLVQQRQRKRRTRSCSSAQPSAAAPTSSRPSPRYEGWRTQRLTCKPLRLVRESRLLYSFSILSLLASIVWTGIFKGNGPYITLSHPHTVSCCSGGGATAEDGRISHICCTRCTSDQGMGLHSRVVFLLLSLGGGA